MDNNVNGDVINIIPDNYVVDVSGISSLDNSQNNELVMNNGEILLFQSNDGSYHTISLTPEQVAELGLQIQYPSTPVSLSTNELTLQQDEVQEPENIILQSSIHDPSTLLAAPQIQRIKFQEVPTEVTPHELPLHRVVRVSELATRGRGFQLITDHIGKESQLISQDSLLKTNGKPKKAQKTYLPANASKANRNADQILTGKFVLTHNDIGSFKPDTKKQYGNAKSVLLPMKQDRKFSLKTARLVSVPNITAPSTIVSQKPPIKPRNGFQLKGINPNLKKTLNIKLPLTPIPNVPNPPRKIFLPEDPNRFLRWNPTQPCQTVHVLQSGDQYQSVERLNGEQLRVVTDALSNVVAKPENKNSVLFDPSSNTRIVYRVVYPEDLNLYEDNKKTKKDKKMKSALPPSIPQTPQVVSVTRSGRHVRLPRHMTTDYQRSDGDPALLGADGASMEVTPSEEDREDAAERRKYGAQNPASHKKTSTCPLCKKVYRGANRMGRHFVMFPDHAITPKAIEMLAKYKSETQAKEIKPKPIRKPDLVEAQNSANHTVTGAMQSNQTSLLNLKDADGNMKKNEDLDIKEERSLFASLVGILERTSEECRAAVFVRQLAALIIKLRRLMPCLLFEDKNNSSCIINEPVGNMLEVSPGKYRLNMEAIKCFGEQSEYCKHITPKPNQTSTIVTSNDNWMSSSNQTLLDKTSLLSDSARKESLDKWTTNVGKRKWIPIGSQDTDNAHSEVMLDNASFSQTVGDLKSWDTTLQKQSKVNESTPGSPWRANIAELSKAESPEQLPPQRHIIEPSNQPVQSDDSISFDCTSKIVDMHSNLVFDMKSQIGDDIGLKDNLTRNGESEETVGSANYDFNDSRFDMQIDSDKLNFTSAQYNEMKYGRDALPPFRKIETSRNIQLPVDSLSDMSSDGEKLHLPTGDAILNDSSYQMASESLELSIENGDHMDTLAEEVCENVPLDSNEDAVHCDDQSLLNGSDLNLPISSANTLCESVSESSLDGSRLNLSSSQSVLHLLDPLGADCLSFGDSELRPTSQMSLDLQLDLFPFHHP